MPGKQAAVPIEHIERAILVIRGQKVMLDADLARLYGVTTRRLKEQVRRNRHRFPDDFMFQLSPVERAEVVAKCDHLRRLKYSPALPYAFTEHGTVMLASVLNSPLAVQASILVVRAFIRLREVLSTQKELAHKLAELERKTERHDEEIKGIFDAIRRLMVPPAPKSGRAIGFRVGKG